MSTCHKVNFIIHYILLSINFAQLTKPDKITITATECMIVYTGHHIGNCISTSSDAGEWPSVADIITGTAVNILVMLAKFAPNINTPQTAKAPSMNKK